METQCKILAYHSGAVDNRSLVVCDAVLTGKLLRTAVTIDQRRTLFTVREEIYFEGQIAFLNTNSPLQQISLQRDTKSTNSVFI